MIQGYFPYLPDYSTWEEFNGNLFVEYGGKNIIFSNEEHWQDTARGLNQSETFTSYAIPSPDGFDDWQSWARAFVTVINGPSR